MTQGAITVAHHQGYLTSDNTHVTANTNQIFLQEKNVGGVFFNNINYYIDTIDEDVKSLIVVKMTTPYLLQTLAGQALWEVPVAGDWGDSTQYDKYDCDYARLMAGYVSELRGVQLPSGYVLRREDVMVMLEHNEVIHQTINAQLNKEYGYELKVNERYVHVLDGGASFPGEFTAPKPEDLAKTCGMEVLPGSEQLPPPAPGGIESVSASGGGGKTLLWVALGAAAVGGAVYFATKKRR